SSVFASDRRGQDFATKPSLLCRARRPAMAFQTVTIEALAVEFPALSHHLRADALVKVSIVVALHHGRAKRPAGSVRGGSAHGNAGHALDATSDSHVVAAGDHALGSKVYSLLARTALAVDRGSGNRLRKSRSQHRIASHVHRLLADLHYAAGD